MNRTAYYKNRAKHFGNRFLRVLINTVMALLLLSAVAFVLWLNFLAAPKTAGNKAPAAGVEGATSPTNSTASPPTASVKTESSGEPASAASEQGASQPAAAPPAEGSPAPATNQPMSTNLGLFGGVAAPKLIVPVAGISAKDLRDTFTSARSEGRTHNALDIMAAHSTPVLAAANGVVRRLMQSDRGGTTIYQLSDDGKLVYYYAHLERYADGLAEGQAVKQGEVIGYVGDTGNAGAGNYHLHFAMWMVSDPKHFWNGENLNPYVLLCH